MKKITIESTPNTPKVEFDTENGILSIEGRVLETNTIRHDDIFTKIHLLLNQYLEEKKTPVKIRFRLNYYNTTSTKNMVRFIQQAEALFKNGHAIEMIWEYENGDDDSLADGELFKRFCSLPFSICMVN
jgi:hypothetical protein